MDKEILQADRFETRRKIELAVERATPVVEDTNLVEGGSVLLPSDVAATRRMLEVIKPVSPETERLYQHMWLTGKTARKMGEAFLRANPRTEEDVNQDELEILGLLHDAGRLISHRWLRSEIIEGAMLRQIGIRKSLTDEIPYIGDFVHKNPQDEEAIKNYVNAQSFKHKVTLMADLYSKRRPDGSILTFDEVMEYHFESRSNYEKFSELKPLWPSERRLDKSVVEFSAKVYLETHKWFMEHGVDSEAIRLAILDEEAVIINDR